MNLACNYSASVLAPAILLLYLIIIIGVTLCICGRIPYCTKIGRR
jgi:hypothetical protein